MNTNLYITRLLVSISLALPLSSCNAGNSDTPAQAHAPERASNKTEHQYAGKFLFDLIDPRKNKGAEKSNGLTSYSSTFLALTSPITKTDRKFIDRITSGPSTPGEMIKAGADDAVIHVTCQAHACDRAKMAVMYLPKSGRMTAVLWDRCQRTILGNPTRQEVDTLISAANMPADTQDVREKCKAEE